MDFIALCSLYESKCFFTHDLQKAFWSGRISLLKDAGIKRTGNQKIFCTAHTATPPPPKKGYPGAAGGGGTGVKIKKIIGGSFLVLK